jgi:predicted esterase
VSDHGDEGALGFTEVPLRLHGRARVACGCVLAASVALVAPAAARGGVGASLAPASGSSGPQPATGDQPVDAHVLEVEADPGRGFNFPYFLVLPAAAPEAPVHLLVEPCNTGQPDDDFEVHRRSAARLAEQSHARRMADGLGVPLLVPVFPRPRESWRVYVQALDRDTMRIESGELERVDLQMLAMVDDARRRLAERGIATHERIFMHGFSASGSFANRFAALHPERVRAVATGGINALPIYPVAELDGRELPFPIGVADLEALTGRAFDGAAYGSVSQFIYMGYLDRNDTLPFSDAWDDDERELIKTVAGEAMMPDRWERSQSILAGQGLPVQFVTYDSIGHETRREMIDDIIEFFAANSGDEHAAVETHRYPFQEYRQEDVLRVAHVNAVYLPGDERLPPAHRELREGTDMALGISDWIQGQDHRQMERLVANAGFRFDVIGPGGETLFRIDEANLNGLRSEGDGDLAVFEVRLDAAQRNLLRAGIEYTFRPVPGRPDFRWMFKEGVGLVWPG